MQAQNSFSQLEAMVCDLRASAHIVAGLVEGALDGRIASTDHYLIAREDAEALAFAAYDAANRARELASRYLAALESRA